MNATAIIQARIGSTRLSNKVLLRLGGKTVLEQVISRVSRACYINDVIVATTVNKENLRIVNLVSKNGISVYCGSEEDVLDRYYQAASLFNLENVVRVTADCPVIDPGIIDKTVSLYFKAGVDYCSNTLVETFPDGQDVEVFSFKALKTAWEKAKLPSEREHVTPYITKHKRTFKLASHVNKPDLGRCRWTLDEKADYDFLKILYKNLYEENPFFGMKEILGFLAEHPEIQEINTGIVRNEGYLKSIREDKKAKD